MSKILLKMIESWWKILGVLLLIFAFLFGILTPLKPGLPSVHPISGQSGETLELSINGYNTNWTKAKDQRFWLKMEDRSLSASQIKVESDNQIQASFKVPKLLPSLDSIVVFTLVVNNEIDGTSILPSAVFIKQNEIDTIAGVASWINTPLDQLHAYSGIAFPYRNILIETIRNLYFHVSLWFAMFILLAIGIFYSIKYLNKGNILDDYRANSLIIVGVIYGILGCATGSIWAKNTWGTWWTMDVKLNMTAVFMLIYMAYFVLRGSFQDEIKRARLAAVYNIFAFASIIPLLFVIPRLVDSLHPGNGGNPGFGGEDLDNTMRIAFYPAIIGMTLIGLWISNLGYRLEVLKNKILDL